MDIALELSRPRSRAWSRAIADHIGNDPKRFAELMTEFDHGDIRTRQRAAWPMSIAAERYPQLAGPYLAKLIDLLPRKDVHSAVKRGIARTLQFVSVPRQLQGKVFSHCIDLVADPSEPIAVRCFAMTAAARVASGRSELTRELKIVSEKQLEYASAGMKVRIRRLLSEK